MDFIKKVEALLDYKFSEFPGPDDLPSDLKFDMRHFEEIPYYTKEFSEPACGLFTTVVVSKSLSLVQTRFNARSISPGQIFLLESLLESLSEIYGADEKLMLYLLEEEKEQIILGDWRGRYWEFDERYNQMNVSLSLDEKGLNLNFYKFWRPWFDDEEDDDDF